MTECVIILLTTLLMKQLTFRPSKFYHIHPSIKPKVFNGWILFQVQLDNGHHHFQSNFHDLRVERAKKSYHYILQLTPIPLKCNKIVCLGKQFIWSTRILTVANRWYNVIKWPSPKKTWTTETRLDAWFKATFGSEDFDNLQRGGEINDPDWGEHLSRKPLDNCDRWQLVMEWCEVSLVVKASRDFERQPAAIHFRSCYYNFQKPNVLDSPC